MKTTIKHRLFAFCASTLYVLSAGHPVLADDTEVLVGSGQANILFIMDTSGSMGSSPPSGGPLSKLNIVKGVFSDLMTNYSGFNVALMRFNSNGDGGHFISPMKPLNSSTRSSIIGASSGLTASGSTPLSETFYEAALYWGGKTVDYGSVDNVAGVASGGNYISPITSQCQKNYTIYLTDGAPTNDTNADTKIAALTGNGCSGNCLDEVATYLHTVDQSSTIPNSPDPQTVETYTIGFATNQNLLKATGLAGGGTATATGNDHYIVANDATQLNAAFTSILDNITTSAINSFSPPAMAANAFNGISHFNKLYYALFEPTAKPKWIGNVKPYIINDNSNLEDADGNNPIDNNGFFTASSRSFWSSSADGASVGIGGANGQLPGAASRNLYTYTGNYGIASNYTLSDSSNALENSVGSNLTPAMLGLTSFGTVLDTIRAAPLGAPLHSTPALVTYGGTETSPDLTLFVATNDGFLHALNATTGVEQFAFIPQKLLPNLPTLASTGSGTVVYGLDGAISTWVKDNNGDHTIDSTAGDHVYVYVGMRRGGSNYYALDVTTRSAPVLKWVIKGGPGGTPGFEELGQTWSKPTLTTIKYGSSSKKVLIFAGGYDTAQDANPLNADPLVPDDTIGRAIYIVDADDGSLLWYASPTADPTASATTVHEAMADMKNSIPSDVRLLDSDLDGYTDRLYVGDMGGRVFRFDLQDSTTTGMTGSGTVLASLSGTTEAENRRFYYPPDVVVTQNNRSTPYISVNIGSGYRAHPLNPTNSSGVALPRVKDRFYSLRDSNVLGSVPAGFSAITDTDLLPVTSRPVLTPAETTTLNSSSGWYIELGAGSGEKVLAPAVTINSEIFFTTYTPPTSAAANSCSPSAGSGKLYRVSLFDGSPVIDQNGVNDAGDGDINDVGDRSSSGNNGNTGLSGTTVNYHKDSTTGNVVINHCEGTECDALPDAIQIQPTYWIDGS